MIIIKTLIKELKSRLQFGCLSNSVWMLTLKDQRRSDTLWGSATSIHNKRMRDRPLKDLHRCDDCDITVYHTDVSRQQVQSVDISV